MCHIMYKMQTENIIRHNRIITGRKRFFSTHTDWSDLVYLFNACFFCSKSAVFFWSPTVVIGALFEGSWFGSSSTYGPEGHTGIKSSEQQGSLNTSSIGPDFFKKVSMDFLHCDQPVGIHICKATCPLYEKMAVNPGSKAGIFQ